MHAIEMTLVQRIREKDIPAVAVILHQSDMLNLDVNAWMGDERLLHEAVRSEDTEVVNFMLSHPEINTALRSRNPEEYTAFHLACQLGNVEVVKCFIDYFNQHGKEDEKFLTTKSARTALMLAAQFGNAETCQLLLAQKINIRVATLEGHKALDIAIERLKFSPKDPEAIAVLKVLLMYGAAFCRDVAGLEFAMPFLDETQNCYFFETNLNGIPLTSGCSGFKNATFFQLSANPNDALVCHDDALFPHFSLRCMEVERNPQGISQDVLKKIKKMRRVFDFNKEDKVTGQSGLSLQALLSHQHGRQLLFTGSPHVREVVRIANEAHFSNDYHICNARIEFISKALQDMKKYDRKKYGWSLGLSCVALVGGVLGLVFSLSKSEYVTEGQRKTIMLTALFATMAAIFWAMYAMKALQGECTPNKLSTALDKYIKEELEKDTNNEGMEKHQLTQFEEITRGTVEYYLQELQRYFAEMEANPASMHTADNALQGVAADTRIEVIPDKGKEEVSEDDSENQENIDLIEMQPHPGKRF